MSLMFMLFALLGAIVVLAGGSYTLRRVVSYLDSRLVVEEPTPTGDPEAEQHVGGYVPAPRPESELSPPLLSRAHDLLARGKHEEAVRMVRDHLGMDEVRARRVVAALADDGTGDRRALEP